MYFSFEIEKVEAIKSAIEKKRSTEELHKVSESIFKFIMKYFYTHFNGGETTGRAKKRYRRIRKMCTNCRISDICFICTALFTSIEIAQDHWNGVR